MFTKYDNCIFKEIYSEFLHYSLVLFELSSFLFINWEKTNKPARNWRACFIHLMTLTVFKKPSCYLKLLWISSIQNSRSGSYSVHSFLPHFRPKPQENSEGSVSIEPINLTQGILFCRQARNSFLFFTSKINPSPRSSFSYSSSQPKYITFCLFF